LPFVVTAGRPQRLRRRWPGERFLGLSVVAYVTRGIFFMFLEGEFLN